MQSTYLNRMYFLLALIALVLCWSQNMAYFHLGPINAISQFIQDTLANPASRSITFDIVLWFFSAAIFMVVEGRRLKMPHVWLYIIFGLLIAISVTFPLFLIAREKRIRT